MVPGEGVECPKRHPARAQLLICLALEPADVGAAWWRGTEGGRDQGKAGEGKKGRLG